MKLLNYIIFFFSAGVSIACAAAPNSVAALPAVIQIILDTPTHLEQVLAAYDDPNSTHIFIAAHRGGREQDIADNAPGNSIANISNAVSKGFDIYESDIEILGDETLVVFHDPTFNALTNTQVPNDALNEANLSYAKSLFLTYTDNSVSSEKIPTLKEFLSAAKGKIMLKFDLKPGIFSENSTQRLINIMQAAVDTGTTEQVLIKGGANLLEVADTNGFDTQMIMRRYNAEPTVADIETLAATYSIRAISIPNGASMELLAAAKTAGLIVEIHESQGVSDLQREADWQAAIDAGFRQFHSFKPGLLLNFLESIEGARRF